MMRILGTMFAALLGLAFGSFLNVCLSRWPEGESVARPRSHCRHCEHTLAWWENIPLLSWLALRGRCRGCGAWIGWRYPVVELAVAGLWAWTAFAPFPDFPGDYVPLSLLAYVVVMRILQMFFLWILVALLMLDMEHLWLPDFLTLPGTLVGLTVGVLTPFVLSKLGAITDFPWTERLGSFRFGLWTPGLERAVAIFVAAGLILLIRCIYWLIRRREGIGLGDAKLMALLAAWLGLPGALLAFGFGVILGAIVAMIVLVSPSTRRDSVAWSAGKLPLGTFLCFGGIISALWGEQIIAAYMRLAGF